MDHLQTVKDTFGQVADSQEDKGINKYGQSLNPLDNYCWLDMALQEQVDGVKYLIAEQEKRKFIADKIWRLVNENCEAGVILEIGHWLDLLEGNE